MKPGDVVKLRDHTFFTKRCGFDRKYIKGPEKAIFIKIETRADGVDMKYIEYVFYLITSFSRQTIEVVRK